MAVKENIITLSNVSKTFDDLEVIGDVSLKIDEGEIVCVFGPSGSGKTTLIRIMAGLLKPDSGTVNSKYRFPGSKLGYMSQGNSLLPWRTAHENVKLALELTGRKNFHDADRALKSVRVEKFKDYYPATLSGGQLQRVNLARTLVLEPKLLLLDEPLSALDLVAKDELSKMIKNYVKTQKAGALLITHSPEEAVIFASKIHILTQPPSRIYKSFDVAKLGKDAYETVSKALFEAMRAGKNEE
ncbi:MAG: ATP-binding cassette domain-containing protein [Alphaproteobacteria bacterium]|nr:ATP-binding cassette domain-containing protein [Alphaproteobacteria bacterium]